MTNIPTVVIVIFMNTSATQGIPAGGFESMEQCSAVIEAATQIVRAEWPKATVECREVPFYAPETSPRPKPRPV